MIYPQTFEQKIGFDKIRAMLKARCQSEAGKELVDQMAFSNVKETVEHQLNLAQEMQQICLMESHFPEEGYHDLQDVFGQLAVHPTYYLDLPAIRLLQRFQETLRQVRHFFAHTKEGLYPHLKALCEPVPWYPAIGQRIDTLLDKYGEIRDNASPALAEIRHAKRQKEQAVSRKIQSLLKAAQDEGIVAADASVSVRDGRMLLPVSAANKRKIQGFIYDESASGKTTFIEPMEVVNLNNQIRELEFAEQREILRILDDFAQFLRPYANDLLAQGHFMATIDFVHAKGRVGVQMNAGRPLLSPACGLFLQRARHPLLEAALAKEGKPIESLTLRLDAVKRILLISGPNAGGKSVCLKTVGLLQYMLQCGLLVPASPTSEFGLFDSLFIDIGDEQSLENDLSTYSSHLLNMREILSHANDRSLLLIDEFGSGTEPAAGGAIAEALLQRWEQRGCFGVITTHYTNLKLYATVAAGVLNGAMQFDVQQIKPLFRLETGVPGNSFAFELAQKTGLPQDVLDLAREKAGVGFVDMEKQIKSIAKNRRRWEEKVAKIKQTDKTLESITDRYQVELSEIQALRKQLITQARQEAARIVEEANKQVEKTIREIREAQAEKEQTKRIRSELQEFKEQLTSPEATATQALEDQKIAKKMEQLRQRKEKREERNRLREAKEAKEARHTAAEKEAPKEEKPWAVGDKVRTKDGGLLGEIVRLGSKTFSVGIGQIVTHIAPENLERISQSQYRAQTRTPRSATVSAQAFNLSERRLLFKDHIDVRGLRWEEAYAQVSQFVDNALMVGASQVRILHGTGNGILRTQIRKYLKTISSISRFEDEHVERGGAGITVIYFD